MWLEGAGGGLGGWGVGVQHGPEIGTSSIVPRHCRRRETTESAVG